MILQSPPAPARKYPKAPAATQSKTGYHAATENTPAPDKKDDSPSTPRTSTPTPSATPAAHPARTGNYAAATIPQPSAAFLPANPAAKYSLRVSKTTHR